MPKNTMMDLQNLIMAQIETVQDQDLTDEELDREIRKSQAVVSLSGRAIDNARLMLDADKHVTGVREDARGQVIGEIMPRTKRLGDGS